MNDDQLRCFLERLREYHQACRIELVMAFDDGNSIKYEVEE